MRQPDVLEHVAFQRGDVIALVAPEWQFNRIFGAEFRPQNRPERPFEKTGVGK